MMRNIDTSIYIVNSSVYLTGNRRGYTFGNMEFHERLKQAIEYSKMTQADIAEKVGIAQPTLSHLQNPEKKAKGSEHTVRLARILGVSPDWLADEEGEMVPEYFMTADPKIKVALKAMEKMPEYAKDASMKEINQIAELIAKAKSDADGTDG